MVNYFLMMTWLPAVVTMVEVSSFDMCRCWQGYSAYVVSAADRSGIILRDCIIKIISKCSYLLIFIFGKAHPFEKISLFLIAELCKSTKIFSNILKCY